MSKYKFIDFSPYGDVTKTKTWVLHLNRPKLHNAFNDEMIEEIISVCERVESTNECELLVLCGEGKSFCAGADLNWMKSMAQYTFEENYEDSLKLSKMFEKLNQLKVPVIGLVHGAVLGGGVGLVSVCDYVVAHSETTFGLTEVRLGLLPAVISPYVVSKIGLSWARSYFTSGIRFKAEKAMAIGLVHEVYENRDDWENVLKRTVESFLKCGPNSRVKAKELVFNLFEGDVQKEITDDLIDYTCKLISNQRVSSEGQEGMSALLNKRKANWIHND